LKWRWFKEVEWAKKIDYVVGEGLENGDLLALAGVSSGERSKCVCAPFGPTLLWKWL
jgi:hypothetical protein